VDVARQGDEVLDSGQSPQELGPLVGEAVPLVHVEVEGARELRGTPGMPVRFSCIETSETLLTRTLWVRVDWVSVSTMNFSCSFRRRSRWPGGLRVEQAV
jgi:hypothetical protein